jgi:hypothetical protein
MLQRTGKRSGTATTATRNVLHLFKNSFPRRGKLCCETGVAGAALLEQ